MKKLLKGTLALIAIVAIVALLFLGGQISSILNTVGQSV